MCFGFGFNRCCRFRNEECFGDFRRRRCRFEESSSSEFCRAVRRCNRRRRSESRDF